MEALTGAEEISKSAGEASGQQYEFRLRCRDKTLVRSQKTRKVELLVEGAWVRVPKPWRFSGWNTLVDPQLAAHAKHFMIEHLIQSKGDTLSRGGRFWRRWGVLRWIVGPFPGGAKRRPAPALLKRRQNLRAEQVLASSNTEIGDLDVLREQALAGYQQLADRCAVLEQRANYFLGAAGLTSTLVLANAGLLLGGSSDRLTGLWLYVGSMALAIASVCAVVAGLRAMQAAMSTFTRCTPSGAGEVEERLRMSRDRLTGCYVGALLVAQEREQAVGDWKLARLKASRRWFSAAIVGVAILTVCVLADAMF
jgi:hypothetical protein